MENDIQDNEEMDEVLFLRANGESLIEETDFFQLAAALTNVGETDYMYVIGAPFSESGWYYKIDSENDRISKAFETYEWSSEVNMNGDSLTDKENLIGKEDSAILEALAKKVHKYIIHATELNDNDDEDVWYIREEVVANMVETHEEDEDGFENSVLILRSGEVAWVENAVELLVDGMLWPYNITLGDIY